MQCNQSRHIHLALLLHGDRLQAANRCPHAAVQSQQWSEESWNRLVLAFKTFGPSISYKRHWTHHCKLKTQGWLHAQGTPVGPGRFPRWHPGFFWVAKSWWCWQSSQLRRRLWENQEMWWVLKAKGTLQVCWFGNDWTIARYISLHFCLESVLPSLSWKNMYLIKAGGNMICFLKNITCGTLYIYWVTWLLGHL